MLFPRFRSKERDLRGDVERFSLIDSAVSRAISEAEQEYAGLSMRLEEARARAAFLYGDVIDTDQNIDPRSSAIIEEAERFLVRGEKRRGELMDHLASLAAIQRATRKGVEAVHAYAAEDEF